MYLAGSKKTEYIGLILIVKLLHRENTGTRARTRELTSHDGHICIESTYIDLNPPKHLRAARSKNKQNI
jgi:hypothetical protein